ncbi:3-deoxy-7-phosphoheptulonate synthase [Tardisphaera miroshnichenkoae]
MMVYFLNDEETFLEAASKSSASYVVVTIYGKRVALAWPDEEAPRLVHGGSYLSIRRPYALSSRDFKAEDTVVRVGDAEIGPGRLTVAAGPCSVEDEEELLELGASLKRMGVDVLRGGAFKPRTSPYSFLGLGEDGLRALERARDELGLPVVSEVLDAGSLPLYRKVDMLQVGTRNAQNFPLLQALGDFNRPVLLKRGMSNTVEEWLAASEYVLSRGNGNVVLCERGIRAPGSPTRFSLDVGAIPKVKRLSHLPLCADPSHSAGERDLVEPLALAGVAAGADMLLIEVHPHPESALSDGDQQITPDAFNSLLRKARALWELVRQAEVKERDELDSRVRRAFRESKG